MIIRVRSARRAATTRRVSSAHRAASSCVRALPRRRVIRAGAAPRPGSKSRFSGFFPVAAYSDFLNECGDGGGRALVFELEPQGTLDRSSLIRAGCRRVHLTDAVDEEQYGCVLNGAAVEVTVEDCSKIWRPPSSMTATLIDALCSASQVMTGVYR